MEKQNIIVTINDEDHEMEQINLDYINDFLSDNQDINAMQDITVPHILNYNDNYTVKELLLICDYYGFSKEIKANKLTKEMLVQCLVDYELDPNNSAIVEKRKNMWFFINELKNDKFMKKYVLW